MSRTGDSLVNPWSGSLRPPRMGLRKRGGSMKFACHPFQSSPQGMGDVKIQSDVRKDWARLRLSGYFRERRKYGPGLTTGTLSRRDPFRDAVFFA